MVSAPNNEASGNAQHQKEDGRAVPPQSLLSSPHAVPPQSPPSSPQAVPPQSPHSRWSPQLVPSKSPPSSPQFAGARPGNLAEHANDPKLAEALSNPKVLQAVQEILSDPAAVQKYENDPEIMRLIDKVMSIGGPDSANLANVAALRCRTDLVKWLQGRPEVLQKIGRMYTPIGLPRECTAHDIIVMFANMHDPTDMLRKSGCTPQEVLYLSTLLPGALRAVPAKNVRKRPPWKWMTICTLVAAAGILIGIFFLLRANYGSGFRVANCRIDQFYNQTCKNHKCSVDVIIREPGKATAYVKKAWTIPLQMDDGKVTMKGDAFRCCDLTGTLSCCALYDSAALVFCDNWPHMVDKSGKTCPSGNWRCLYKVNKHNNNEASEVLVYNPPHMLPFIIASSVLVGFGVVIIITRPIWVRCTICCDHFLVRIDNWQTSAALSAVKGSNIIPPKGENYEDDITILQNSERRSSYTAPKVDIGSLGADSNRKIAKRASAEVVYTLESPPAPVVAPVLLSVFEDEHAQDVQGLHAPDSPVDTLVQSPKKTRKRHGATGGPRKLMKVNTEAGHLGIDNEVFRRDPWSSGDLSKYATPESIATVQAKCFAPIIDPLPPRPNGSWSRGTRTKIPPRRNATNRHHDQMTSWHCADQSQFAATGLLDETCVDPRPVSTSSLARSKALPASLSSSLRVTARTANAGGKRLEFECSEELV